MKTLWITRERPDLWDRGDTIYSSGLVNALAAAGSQVVVVCAGEYAGGDVVQSEFLSIRAAGRGRRSRLGSLISVLPSDPYKTGTSNFKRIVAEQLEHDAFDVVVIDHLAMGWALPVLEAKRRERRFLVVYVAHNVEGKLRHQIARDHNQNPIMGPALLLDSWKYGRLESRIINEADLVIAITPKDAAELGRMTGAPVVCLTPGYSGEVRGWSSKIDESLPRRAVIVGSFEWIAKQRNLIDFVDAAAEPFRASRVKLQIVGRSTEHFRSKVMRQHSFCDFVGPVKSIDPFLRSCRIGVMPDVLGGGFKLKILDYVFSGVPVAAISSQVEGMPLAFYDSFIGASNVNGLVAAIVENMDRTEYLDVLRAQAYRACVDAFKWGDRGVQLREVLASLVQRRRT